MLQGCRSGRIDTPILVPVIDLRLPAVDVAPQLLGAVIRHTAVLADGTRGEVGIRLTEVEAYMGLDDPASHAFGGPTPRSAVMFGPPGHIYVYLSYGIHRCMNIVCSPDGQASAVLLRAGEVVIGKDLARARRSARAAARGLPAARPLPARRLASGPGNLGQALGAELTDSGAPLSQAAGASPAPDGSLWTLEAPASPADHVTSTRIGISRNAEKPWRFAIPGDPTVSGHNTTGNHA
ncbi:Putative 3-methyladenine DNA glycosylase [Acidipropionibacterium virtanenii]|uniref:Putative 3-methyladenine DNA glycosylase n=1 Tax=Acidipropionibacterium virtanenii TaxID=2057246 RepID=A0A344UXF3_9ACTN|nr:Putative 3-methyladenine DNA glycosylase [Acidipropionibacterium virtanenii]